MDAASDWVRRWAPLAPPGEVLDLACGKGRHARLFAALGHPVLALDRDPAALAASAGQGITPFGFDLEEPALEWPFAPRRFAAIVVTNYLHRPLMGRLLDSLAPDGLLIYETFARGNEAYGKPSNPAFLLEPGELLAYAAHAGLRPIAYEDGLCAQPKPAMRQRLCACGPAFDASAARLDGAGQRETGQE